MMTIAKPYKPHKPYKKLNMIDRLVIAVGNFIAGIGFTAIPEFIESLDPTIAFFSRVASIIAIIISSKFFIEATRLKMEERKKIKREQKRKNDNEI